jgi:hypothetical protein
LIKKENKKFSDIYFGCGPGSEPNPDSLEMLDPDPLIK